MSNSLIVRPAAGSPDGTLITVTPQSAGWGYVGFELLRLAGAVRAQRATGEREVAIVVISGLLSIDSPHGRWEGVGGRADPFAGRPDAAERHGLDEQVNVH